MRFDGDAYLASLAPPTFTVGGRTYVGRHLSAEEQVAHLQALQALQAPEGEGVSDAAARATVHAFVAALFPEPLTPALPRSWWRPWRRPPPPLTVVDLFAALPMGAQAAALQCFSQVLASTMLPRRGTPGPTTPDAPSANGRPRGATPPPSGTSSPASSRATAPPRTTTPRATARGTG